MWTLGLSLDNWFSTSQYHAKDHDMIFILPRSLNMNMMVANWGEMHLQKVVEFQPLPHTWPPKYDIFYTKICTFYDINMMVASLAGPIRVRILSRGYMDPYWACSTGRIFSRIGPVLLWWLPASDCWGTWPWTCGTVVVRRPSWRTTSPARGTTSSGMWRYAPVQINRWYVRYTLMTKCFSLK